MNKELQVKKKYDISKFFEYDELSAMHTYLLKNKNEIDIISYEESLTSDSKYLTLQRNGIKWIVRISNHSKHLFENNSPKKLRNYHIEVWQNSKTKQQQYTIGYDWKKPMKIKKISKAMDTTYFWKRDYIYQVRQQQNMEIAKRRLEKGDK